MRIAIVCKVIDNFGDAGFCLRLAKALATQNHRVFLLHDHPATLQLLYPRTEFDHLNLVEASAPDFDPRQFDSLDLIIEPFGTSSEQTQHRFELGLKAIYKSTPWLVVDYLSAEDWVESFHLNQAVDPATGHRSTLFYPGFNARTGGLIHCDLPANLQHRSATGSPTTERIFVFAYPNAPLKQLAQGCEQANHNGANWHIDCAGSTTHEPESNSLVKHIGFRPQSEFDDLLSKYDLLFVRGEDSFVRAQLAGKPMVWQIYPTEDNAHQVKLKQFFSLYCAELEPRAALALWRCWQAWNRTDEQLNMADCWIDLLAYMPTLKTHALGWQHRLLNGPELVSEILTWRSKQTPTLQD